ncbi:hypothetical protein LKO31_08070 [Sphingopyxis sp. FBM22]|nr:hypothetical protein [Sphingopyxis yananensis]
MDDMQSKVAARRAQLAQQEREAGAKAAVATAQRQLALQQQKEAAVDTIAAELSINGVAVVGNGDELSIVDQPLPPLDVEGLKHAKIDSLLKREARKLWSPGENWLVIGCIVGGICLIHLGGLGFIPLLFGLWRGSAINKKHRATVREAYPDIFDTSNSAMPNNESPFLI